MYNLYTFQKKQSDKEKKIQEEKKNQQITKKHKSEIKKLSKKYNNRMHNFIISLCKKPVYIKDINTPTNNNSQQNKTLYKNFSFGDFITDKERIKLYNEQKEINRKCEEKIYRNKLKQELKILKSKKNDNILQQPSMRFKPRNDLERINDAMNLLGANNKNKKKIKIILERLKKIDFEKKFKVFKNLYKIQAQNLIQNLDSINKNTDDDSDNDLDFSLETNIYRKIRNYNIQQKKLLKQRQIDLDILNNGKENNIIINKHFNINNIASKLEKYFSTNNKIKSTRNNKKLLELFKEDEKLYFKGASQYVNLLGLKNKLKNKRSVSAIQFENLPKHKTNLKKQSALIKNYQRGVTKSELSMSGNLRELDQKFQVIKKRMNKIANKEISNSILDEFVNKFHEFAADKGGDINFYDQSFLYDDGSLKNINDKKNLELKNKLNYLKEVIKKDEVNNVNFNVNKFNTSKRNLGEKGKEKEKEIRKLMREDDNEVIIDGIKYQKFKEIKTIADIIFKKCGYYNDKLRNKSSDFLIQS